jgi:hypothetical protein
MSVRTIQHPGVEIREIDLTEYQNTITTNNTYVMGFADKGKIYDYSWVSTRSEFINTYGLPQTEAERYLFNAVESILNNGGTPLVARMPYDNKQCKAYRGIKIRYAAINNKNEIDEWGGASFDAKYNPLINFNTVTQRFNESGMLSGDINTLVNEDIYKINIPSELKVKYKDLTYGSFLGALCPIEEDLNGNVSSFNSILTETGLNAVSSVVSSWTDDVVSSLTINDIKPAELGIGAAVIKNTIENFIGTSAGKELRKEGLEKALSLNIAEDINSLSGILSGKLLFNASGLLNNIQEIYKNPLFISKVLFDGDTDTISGSLESQAVIDAMLIKQPATDYKYGVYLDSKEVEISNEQYDDLVTSNRFTKYDSKVSKYGEDIDDANFIIVDKSKSIVSGPGSNEGIFISIIDPFDALKMQRLLANPLGDKQDNVGDVTTLEGAAKLNETKWKQMYKSEIDMLDTLQRVKNADGIFVGEKATIESKKNLYDSWSVPLFADYYNESISKNLMGSFPAIPLTDVGESANSSQCTIDKEFSSYIVVAVCKSVINPSDGKVTVSVLETFFGSLFNEQNPSTGRKLFIGDIINNNSKYIEFYKNNYVATKEAATNNATLPPEYQRTPVPQFFIKNSMDFRNACSMAGIEPDSFETEAELITACKENNIFVFDKISTILYNIHPEATFASYSKKEASKIIANTTGLFGKEAGTTMNIADNFLIDMDRCINFIRNVDEMPMYFVCDAGLSTIAQFCDNVTWDKENSKWITQQFDPDNDPNIEDKDISDYTDVATWRKVVNKLDQISREIRRDCMTIIDAPRQLTLDGAAQKIRRSKPTAQFDSVIGNRLKYISGMNSSYTAGYYNWLRTTDTNTGASFWLPPTCKVIGNLVYLNAVNLPWLAPAGLNYGRINGVYAVSHNPNATEEDQIYMKSWNYIKQYPFDGFVIEGQKTTLTKDSAFNRLNVRTLFLDLERFVANVAKTYKYQVNNQYTREQFVQTLKPKFEDYMMRGGMYGYLIKCDDSNNTPETIDHQELHCAIYIKPARLIEYILVDMIATKTGANFDELVN